MSDDLAAYEATRADDPDHEIGRLYMVFDVESVGLGGEGFAVAWVLIDRTGLVVATGDYGCDPALAAGSSYDLDWVRRNVKARVNCDGPRHVREAFWADWRTAHGLGAILVADCHWPVEARFLHACVEDGGLARVWEGPLPLHELATALLMAGRDPVGIYPRQPDELPAHDPLADARQSARLWAECLAARPTPPS